MKTINKLAVGLLSLVVMGGVAFTPVASAALLGGSDNDLGDLFLLDRLFAGNGTVFSGGTSGTVTVQAGDTLSAIAATYLGNASRYTEIAALNNLSNPNLIVPGQVLAIPAATTGGTTGGILGNGNNSLGNLIILDQLFNNDGGVIGGSGDSKLGDLIILDQLFGGGVLGGSGSGLFMGTGTNNLGDLIILDRLFNDNGGLF